MSGRTEHEWTTLNSAKKENIKIPPYPKRPHLPRSRPGQSERNVQLPLKPQLTLRELSPFFQTNMSTREKVEKKTMCAREKMPADSKRRLVCASLFRQAVL